MQIIERYRDRDSDRDRDRCRDRDRWTDGWIDRYKELHKPEAGQHADIDGVIMTLHRTRECDDYNTIFTGQQYQR